MYSSKIKKYIQNAFLYFGASIIPMALNLIANPFIAMNMAPEQYGITGYYTSFSSLLSPMILFYMLHYYTKSYYEVKEENRDELRAIVFKSLIYFSSLLTILGLVGLIIYIKFFNKEVGVPLFPYVFFTVLALPLSGVYTMALVDYRMERNGKSFFHISTISGVVLVLVTLLFVVVLKWGALGKLLAPLVVNLFLFIWACYHYRRLFRLKFDKYKFWRMLKFCFPLTLAAMLGFFSNGYDRVFLERLGDMRELGIYVVGIQMAGYISVFETAISSTFQPDIYQNIIHRNYRRLAQIIGLMIGSVALTVLAFIIAAPFIIDILTAGRYIMSVKYAQIAALSALTSTMYYTTSQITVALGKTYITLKNKIITSIGSIALFSYLISNYQFIGAAWGLVGSFLISFLGNILLLIIDRYCKYERS